MTISVQPRLPFHPTEAVKINEAVSYLDDGVTVGYFADGVPTFLHARGDAAGQRVAWAQIITLGLATQKDVGSSFGICRTTLYRHQRRLKEAGIAGLVDEKSGPKRPHKLTPKILLHAQKMLDGGKSNNVTSKELCVNEGTIRNAIRQGWLHKTGMMLEKVSSEEHGSQPGERNAQDAVALLGVATTRVVERALAATGKIEGAAPEFKPALSVANAGALLALPAMLELGLLEVGENVYGSLRNGFYGLRSTLLCLGFMALLRIRNPERMQFEAPGEL